MATSPMEIRRIRIHAHSQRPCSLDAVGSFLAMGLFGIVIASLVNLFLASSALQWTISIVGVVVFAGLTAWDTQKIKEMYSVTDDGTVAGRKAIMGALSLAEIRAA